MSDRSGTDPHEDPGLSPPTLRDRALARFLLPGPARFLLFAAIPIVLVIALAAIAQLVISGH